MSYQYRYYFIEHLLQTRNDLIEEVVAATQANESINGEEQDEGAIEEFLFERKHAMNHFYSQVYESLSQQPYSIYFYLTFSKELIRNASNPAV